MLLTYLGIEDNRTITREDLVRLGLEVDLPGDFTYLWGPGATLEVPDDVGNALIEADRRFKNRSDTTRDMRTVEELLERARELEIKGRSKMDRDQLLEAITALEIELEAASAPDESIDDQGSIEKVPGDS